MSRKSFAVWMLTIITGCLGYTIAHYKTAWAQTSETFGGNIVLERPTDLSITVNVLFTANQDEVYLEYGLASGTYTNQVRAKQSS